MKENFKFYLLLAVVCKYLITGFRGITDAEVQISIKKITSASVKKFLKKCYWLKLDMLAMRNKYKTSDGKARWGKFYNKRQELMKV